MQNKILAENRHGVGSLPKRVDLRDHKWRKLVGKSAIPFDWSVGYNPTDNSPTKDQGTSDSCGGNSGAYLSERLITNKISAFFQQSAKSIYSYIFYNGGGTTIRDIGARLTGYGANLEADVPSYPNTEQNFEDKSWSTPALTIEAGNRKILNYAMVNPDIESVAEAIRDTGGCLIEIEGQNGLNPSWLSATPTPPTVSSSSSLIWRHFLFAGGAFMQNGVKYIRCHNSWGAEAGDNGWQLISEDYFKSGHIVGAMVLYEPSNPVITNPVTKSQAISLIQKLINLYYQLLGQTAGGTQTQPMKTTILKSLLNIVILGVIIYLFASFLTVKKEITILGQASISNQTDSQVIAQYLNQGTNGNFAQYIQSLQKK